MDGRRVSQRSQVTVFQVAALRRDLCQDPCLARPPVPLRSAVSGPGIMVNTRL